MSGLWALWALVLTIRYGAIGGDCLQTNCNLSLEVCDVLPNACTCVGYMIQPAQVLVWLVVWILQMSTGTAACTK